MNLQGENFEATFINVRSLDFIIAYTSLLNFSINILLKSPQVCLFINFHRKVNQMVMSKGIYMICKDILSDIHV